MMRVNPRMIMPELKGTAFNLSLLLPWYSTTYFDVATDIPKSPKVMRKKIIASA